jgi:cytoskeletal protein CcmA (bactofilin family)
MAIFNSGSKPTEEAKNKTPEAKISLIASGVTIEGTVVTDGDIRIEGRLVGTLVCKARLVLGTSGSIEGVVDAYNAAVAGTIRGNVVVRDMIQMQETGKIEGDLIAVKMAMQVGGGVSGNIKTGQGALDHIKNLPPIEKLLKEVKERTAPKASTAHTPLQPVIATPPAE